MAEADNRAEAHQPRTFAPDYEVGAYRVIRLIGRGGMGAVYEVEHVALGTHYALKAFAMDPNDPYADVLREKFLAEARQLAVLKHPNLTHVFDLAVDPVSGLPYFVMDLVLYEDGEPHTVVDVDRADITENLVYLWFKDVAAALDYIHAQGIVHRDIKPGNMLLREDLHVVVTDFGVSRIFGERTRRTLGAERTMARCPSETPLVLGTEHFMAPEVVAGGEATPAADAYALGMVCFRLLTGLWYEPGADAVGSLARFKLRWAVVLPQLLSPHAERRPKELLPLKAHLKGAPPPAAPEPPPPPRRAARGRRLLGVAFALLAVAGLAWFGRQAWTRYEADRVAAAHRAAELQRQIDEQRRETARIEDARRRTAEEAEAKRLAEEKARAEKARLAAERRAQEDASRTEIARGESAPMQTTPPVADETTAPKSAEKKTAFTFEEAAPEEEQKDYGPIPKRTYVWLKGGRADSPLSAAFALANGAPLDLVPLKAATFYMSNDWRDGRTHHKVTLTRPFWMSKYLVTAAQWREFAPNDCEDCRPVEKALEGTPYTVSKAVSRPQIDAFCAYLSAKYRTQLPKGYVFRLPTEAEWEYALDLPGTERLYEDKGGWDACANYSSSAGVLSMKELRRAKNLDAVCAWSDDENWVSGGGFDKTLTIFVGGRMKPFSSGAFDFRWKVCPFLDTVEGNWRNWDGTAFRTDVVLPYGDTAVDPLRRAPPSAKSVRTLYRESLHTRKASDARRRVFFHLVLGPDLLAERAWAHAPSEPPKPVRREPLAMRPQKWDPKKAPRKLNRPRTYAFELDNGAKMAFCLCPAGTFNMSNIEGQDRRFHRVTLTRPFLITTYNVTAAQWRDFGRHDCEGVARELEQAFSKGKEPLPVCVSRNRIQWARYCDHLNARYRSILPEGYVFRLPTEAELEWAMLADENGSAYDLDWTRFGDDTPRVREDLAKRLNRLRFADVRHFDLNGWYRGYYVGGRTAANAWGIRDFRMSNMCLDLLDADWRKNPEQLDCKPTGQACLARDRPYLDHETDPLRWDGRRSGFPLARHSFSARGCGGNDMFNMSLAHLVIGPDLEGPLRRQEEGPYPEADFGGRFVGDRAKLTEMSSREPHNANRPERHRLLLSRENTLVRTMDLGEDLRGCHTQKESSPWILIELEKPVTLAGIQVEAFIYRWLTRHLRIWAADEDKKMRLVASDDRELRRHRFDLNGKNVRAKYIRIGREPGFKDDYFSLDKVLIYAKPSR